MARNRIFDVNHSAVCISREYERTEISVPTTTRISTLLILSHNPKQSSENLQQTSETLTRNLTPQTRLPKTSKRSCWPSRSLRLLEESALSPASALSRGLGKLWNFMIVMMMMMMMLILSVLFFDEDGNIKPMPQSPPTFAAT